MDSQKPNSFSFDHIQTAERQFIQRVYQWMAAGLSVTGFVAYAVATNPALLRALAGGWFLVLAIAEIALVWWLSSAIVKSKISAQAAVLGFLVYSMLNGLTLSFIFAAYTGASIATTLFITAGSFAGISLFGWVTQADLTSIRSFLFMGLIGIIIGSLVNIFFQSPVFYWILTYASLAVFIGLTAYDTQKLKQIHQSGFGATEQMAILGALALYLDFINLFILLLRLFGRRR